MGSEWELSYDRYEPAEEPLREALCTLGNGYVATRGAAPETAAGGAHYPGTYLAGLYNRLTTRVADRDVENEDLVNVANWLPLTFRVDGGAWFAIDEVDIVAFSQTLDLRRGVLHRHVRFRDDRGRTTSLAQRRILSMADPHLGVLETSVRAEDWSGTLTLRSGLDGSVRNTGVERYRALRDRHLEALDATEHPPDLLLLRLRTVQSRVEIISVVRTRVWLDDAPVEVDRQCIRTEDTLAHQIDLIVHQGQTARVEKLLALFTSRDRPVAEPGGEALTAARRAGDFEALLRRHVLAWEELWRRFRIHLDADRWSATVLNLHVFHLLQTTSDHTIDLDVGAPARGWHGEAYRGHVFWDELFIFPLLVYRAPDIARALLQYRHRRLPAARQAARAEGHAGAMFPWQSGSSGREESQVVHLNPTSGRWIPDNTHRQRHIGIAVAYNVWLYHQVSDDVEFLARYGAEVFCEIARFFTSLATYDPIADRYVICGVMGPDEFHTADPNWSGPALRNNAYTNVMAAWLLWHASELLEPLPLEHRRRVLDRLGLTSDELLEWDTISRKLFVPFSGDGILSQFEGYEQLAEFDWDGYRERYGDIQRLDRILEAEGDTPNRYKISKQADVLMLFYLLSLEELTELFDRLGYAFDGEQLRRTVEYYLARTSHGSTLSKVVHSWVMARTDRPASYALFTEALLSDVGDVQGGTTAEGIHLGAMAGTVDLLERGYTGMEIRDGILRFKPSLPDEIGGVRFRIYFQRRWITVSLSDEHLHLESEPTDQPPVTVVCRTREEPLASGASLAFTRDAVTQHTAIVDGSDGARAKPL